VDETSVPVLDPGRGKTKTGYFWAIARDDRPWGGTDPPAVAYTYAPGRGGEHLEKLLANYRGIVQCDGYAPYKKLPAKRITVAFCWSHLRCEFFRTRAPGKIASARRRTQDLLRTPARAALGWIGYSQDHPLRSQALGRPHPLPRRWPHRARHQHRRAFDAPTGSDAQECVLRRSR